MSNNHLSIVYISAKEFDLAVGANPVLQVEVKPYILRLNPT